MKVFKLYDDEVRHLLNGRSIHYRMESAMNENFSLILMSIFLIATILFLADQILSYQLTSRHAFWRGVCVGAPAGAPPR